MEKFSTAVSGISAGNVQKKPVLPDGQQTTLVKIPTLSLKYRVTSLNLTSFFALLKMGNGHCRIDSVDKSSASIDEKRSAKKDVIEEALRRMGKAPSDSDILMIGDRMHDIEGAQLCGLDSLGIYTGFAPEGELENAGATYVFHTINDMAAFLLGD